MIVRKIIGLLIVLVGILLGLALSVVPIMIMLAYCGARRKTRVTKAISCSA